MTTDWKMKPGSRYFWKNDGFTAAPPGGTGRRTDAHRRRSVRRPDIRPPDRFRYADSSRCLT